jgi:Fe-S-cluster-containing dehydrogenase component
MYVSRTSLSDEQRRQVIEDASTLAGYDIPNDSLYFIRSGSVTLSRTFEGKERVLSYVPAGSLIGVEAVFNDYGRFDTARAAIATEAIRIEKDALLRFLDQRPRVRDRLRRALRNRLAEQAQTIKVQSSRGGDSLLPFLMNQGIGEATDVLLIDESLCVRCDNCEKACAETHFGVSRLDRESGPTFAQMHLPTSCRHCEHPHCMTDCPPNALARAPDGEIYINDSCIGCGNCERNCPYNVIKMAPKAEPPAVNVFAWLLFGRSRAPGLDLREAKHDKDAKKIATKCDMCQGLTGGPACVRACPTGAAIRVKPEQFMAEMQEDE